MQKTALTEFELYVPLVMSTGNPTDSGYLHQLKEQLNEEFGGYTFFPHKNEGSWKFAGRSFYDEIVILKVLAEDQAKALSWFRDLKTKLCKDLKQKDILILMRDVNTV